MRLYDPEWDDPRPRCIDCRCPLDSDARRCDGCQAKIERIERELQDLLGYCEHCEAPIRNTRRRSFCSAGCANAHRVDEAMAMADHFAKLGDIATATGWRHRLFGYLVDRDGTDCYLCRMPVNLEESGNEGPSVDHVRPRAKGGTHDTSNLRLTHRLCNTRKGARELDEYHRRWG